MNNFEKNKFDFVDIRNPRKDELLKKQREIELSPEESAELKGLFAFRENPRGASLLKKQVLGQTSEEEDEELRIFFQNKFSSEFKK